MDQGSGEGQGASVPAADRARGWRREAPWVLLTLLLPALLFHWLLPFVSPIGLGNDYGEYQLPSQQELLLSLEHGSFPLYAPGFGGGQASVALINAQLFHPLPHLAARLPGYWSGQALEWVTLLRLLSLGVAHLLVTGLLRRVGLPRALALLLGLVCVYNQRSLDLFRYGPAVDGWAAFLALCVALARWRLDGGRGWAAGVVTSAWLLTVNGNIQVAYYALPAAGALLLALPALEHAFQIQPAAAGARCRLRGGGLLGLGVLLGAAYLVPFYWDFVRESAGRVGRDYAWANGFNDTLSGTLCSFVLPLRADVHGAFGGSSLLLAGALLPVLRFAGRPLPRVVWLAWGAALLVFLHAQGERTPVHWVVWRFAPLASALRVPGRVTLLLPPLLVLLLAWAALQPPWRVPAGRRALSLSPLGLLAGLALLLSLLAQLVPWAEPTAFSPLVLRQIPPLAHATVLEAGLLALAALVAGGDVRRPGLALWVAGAATLLQLSTTLQYGTWQARKPVAASLEQLRAQKRESLDYGRRSGFGLWSATVARQLERSCLEPELARLYARARHVPDVEAAYAALAAGRGPDEVIVETSPGEPPLPAADLRGARVALVYAAFNRLDLEVESPAPAWLGLGYPWSGRWSATIDGASAPLWRANGAAHALRVPAGTSRVRFTYWSRAHALGAALSALALVALASWGAADALGPRRAPPAALLTLALAGGALARCWLGLHAGQDLGTRREWTWSPPPDPPNLAYARRTWTSSLAEGDGPDRCASGRAVDEVTRAGSGFRTFVEEDPTWTLDLGQPLAATRVVLHEGNAGPQLNLRPLLVEASLDGSVWRELGRVEAPGPAGAVTLAPAAPFQVRWLRVRSPHRCALTLDEVELF